MRESVINMEHIDFEKETIDKDLILSHAYDNLYKPNRSDLERGIIDIDNFAHSLNVTRDLIGSYVLGWFENIYKQEEGGR